MPEYAKDVMVAVLGASVGLAGLLLVFSGFLFSRADSFDKANTDDTIINKYRNAGRLAGIPFLLSFAVAFLSIWWMTSPGPCVYMATVIGLCALLIVSAFYGGFILLVYL